MSTDAMLVFYVFFLGAALIFGSAATLLIA